MGRSAVAYHELARTLRACGRLGEAWASAQRALTLFDQLENSGGIADALDMLALTHYEQGVPGACAESLKLLERSLEIRRSDGQAGKTANTLDLIGMVCISRGDMNRSFACFTESLNAHRAVDDWVGIGFTLSAMTAVSRKLGRANLAERHIEEALEVGERTGDVESRIRIQSAYASLSIHKGEFDEATGALERVIELAEEVGSSEWMSEGLRLRAKLQLALGEIVPAFQDSALALELAQAGEGRLRLSSARLRLAEVQGAMISERVQPRPSATNTRDHFLEALNAFEEMGDWHEAANALRSYGAFLLERGKKTEATRCISRAEKLDPLTTH